MQAAIQDIDMSRKDYNFHKQSYFPEADKEIENKNKEVPGMSLEQTVFENVGSDVVSNIGYINNPLSDPESREAFRQRIAEQVNTEMADTGYEPEEKEVVLPGTGNASEEEAYEPKMLGSGDSKDEIVLPGTKNASEEKAYEPKMLGSGDSEDEIVLPGTKNNSEEKAYEPKMLGSGDNTGVVVTQKEVEVYNPKILGSGDSDTENADVKVYSIRSEIRAERPRTENHAEPKKHRVERSAAHGDNRDAAEHHTRRVTHKKSHKKISLSRKSHSSIDKLHAQIESNIKENMKNNRESMRRMRSYADGDEKSMIEDIADMLKNNSDENVNDYIPKHNDDDAACECPTCKNRRFVDKSNDIGVSFSSPQRLDSPGAEMIVRSHENEHLSAAYRKAFREGKTVVRQSVTIYKRSCPDCGTNYVAGGVTRTVTKMRADIAYKKAMENVKKKRA
ncbi:MAG: hypothetical protein J1F64_04045 [Oscillospiraceae bacterium]|nr:hypothetical protein [Oscillospiraceae bacterium]